MQARLIESKSIGPEVRHFSFDVPEVDHLPFSAGQFVSLTREIRGKKITRAYSICCPSSGNTFELCLNRVQDGFLSPFLFDMQPGETVDMKGPLGGFVWRNPVRDSILVATGTGIAPFRGMLLEYLKNGGEREITLIFGVRHEESLLYREEFEQLAREHPNFHFRPTLTQPRPEWTGLTGRVQAHALAELGERRDMDVYICGMKAMVDDLRTQLKALGLDRKQIIYEKYD
jgi:CDP-4-dehydro-6-deoxyglucose reductase